MQAEPQPLDRTYLDKMLDVMPVSDKHHHTYKMLLFPSKHAMFLVDVGKSLLIRNVADFQLHHLIEAKPDVLAGIFGVTVTPEKTSYNPLGWWLIASVKGVPILRIEPTTLIYQGVKRIVVDAVTTMDRVVKTPEEKWFLPE